MGDSGSGLWLRPIPVGRAERGAHCHPAAAASLTLQHLSGVSYGLHPKWDPFCGRCDAPPGPAPASLPQSRCDCPSPLALVFTGHPHFSGIGTTLVRVRLFVPRRVAECQRTGHRAFLRASSPRQPPAPCPLDTILCPQRGKQGDRLPHHHFPKGDGALLGTSVWRARAEPGGQAPGEEACGDAASGQPIPGESHSSGTMPKEQLPLAAMTH